MSLSTTRAPWASHFSLFSSWSDFQPASKYKALQCAPSCLTGWSWSTLIEKCVFIKSRTPLPPLWPPLNYHSNNGWQSAYTVEKLHWQPSQNWTYCVGVKLHPWLFLHLLYSHFLVPLQTQEMSKADSCPILNFQTHWLSQCLSKRNDLGTIWPRSVSIYSHVFTLELNPLSAFHSQPLPWEWDLSEWNALSKEMHHVCP